ncbi:MAG: hypothetical protein GC179_19215 [Anaerolineaceae bacterium]|nr:hypothetical protein [Anaerolineaceae bacterium]
MDTGHDQVIAHYADAYQKLYNRQPRDLQNLDNGWVIVNGARMKVSELEYLTYQLQQEINQDLYKRRNVVTRLLKWLKQ